MNKCFKVFLIGPMGAGKSTIGRHLAREMKLDFYDTDQVIEQRTGADLNWIFDIEGEAGFREREKRVIEELTQKQNIILATGGGVVVTPENRTVLAARGTVIYLRASLDQQLERTRKDTRRPLLQTEDIEERLHELGAHREPFYEDLADHSFETDGCSVKSVANSIVKVLQSSS